MQAAGHWAAPLPDHVPSLTAGAATQTPPMQLLHTAGIQVIHKRLACPPGQWETATQARLRHGTLSQMLQKLKEVCQQQGRQL